LFQEKGKPCHKATGIRRFRLRHAHLLVGERSAARYEEEQGVASSLRTFAAQSFLFEQQRGFAVWLQGAAAT
jgi:hypothetical protein